MDDTFNVSLLEVNAVSREPGKGCLARSCCRLQCPDFAQTGAELQGVIDHLFKCTVGQVVLPFFRRLDGSEQEDDSLQGMQQIKGGSDGLRRVMTMEVSRAW